MGLLDKFVDVPQRPDIIIRKGEIATLFAPWEPWQDRAYRQNHPEQLRKELQRRRNVMQERREARQATEEELHQETERERHQRIVQQVQAGHHPKTPQPPPQQTQARHHPKTPRPPPERADPPPRPSRPHYEEIRLLGAGAQGQAYLIKRVGDSKLMVRKTLGKFEMAGNIALEVEILRNTLGDHRRIVRLFYSEIKGPDLRLYTEYCVGGDLEQYCISVQPEKTIWHIFAQLAEALAYLHHGHLLYKPAGTGPPRGWQKVVHSDVKPANIFLRTCPSSSAPLPDLVLGDFGLAHFASTPLLRGDSIYCGPEYPRASTAGDIWGLGATIHQIAHGYVPICSPPSGIEIDRWLKMPEARRAVRLPEGYSEELNDCMMECLRWMPRDRIDGVELVKKIGRDRRTFR